MEGKRIRGRRSVNRSQREAERAYPEEIDNKGGRGRGRNEKEKGGGKRKNDAKRHRRQRCRKKPGSSDVFREKFSEGDGYVDQSFFTHPRTPDCAILRSNPLQTQTPSARLSFCRFAVSTDCHSPKPRSSGFRPAYALPL